MTRRISCSEHVGVDELKNDRIAVPPSSWPYPPHLPPGRLYHATCTYRGMSGIDCIIFSLHPPFNSMVLCILYLSAELRCKTQGGSRLHTNQGLGSHEEVHWPWNSITLILFALWDFVANFTPSHLACHWAKSKLQQLFALTPTTAGTTAVDILEFESLPTRHHSPIPCSPWR